MSKKINSMIEVFKTNVVDRTQAERMLALLVTHFGAEATHQAETSHIIPEKVIEVMNNHGYQCMVLE